MSPIISILTPSWNRASYLDRVWKSLDSQTYKNFEWIVSNDGSTDETQAKIEELAAKSAFPITVITASHHIGKARMDNEAVRHAHGEFIVWCDSDDYFLPQAMERLVEVWNSIEEDERPEFVGLVGLCRTEEGDILTQLPFQERFDTTWNELSEIHRVTGDMVYLARAEALRNHPFPEVDFIVPESAVWSALGERRVRVCPEALKVIEYGAMHCVSFSGRMEYNRGRAIAMALSEHNLRRYPKTLSTRLWRAITYLRYSIHGELGAVEALSAWGANFPGPLIVLLYPIAYILASIDTIRGKVRKTHREFLAAQSKTKINVIYNNMC
ncbi:hypothetical protein AMST5_03880 [freshwater sediment metagenome]|uniref:Glycosyltransferase 2-like domain-containing protein n=1 Tax=freshwater sediment metagenome TaxID=556182 RepID=A0AA48REZ9_9ZZZZ